MPEQSREFKGLSKSQLLLDGLSSDSAPLSTSEILRREIEAEQEVRNRESVLSRSLTSVMGAFRGQTALDKLRSVDHNSDKIRAIVHDNKAARLYEHDVAEIGTAALKTGCLFLKGRTGIAATAVVYGLDSIKPGSNMSEMALDGSLGVSKGLLNRKFLDWSHKQGWSVGKTGVMLGGFSRLTESSLTRQTYLDKDGKLDISLGSRRIVETTLNPAAIAMDYALFKVAGAGVDKLDAVVGGKLLQNPVMRNAATGGIFGMSTGFSGEALRQLKEHDFDPKRLLTITLTRGLVDGVAAMPGGFQTQRMMKTAAAEQARLAQPVSSETTSINISLGKGIQALPESTAIGTPLSFRHANEILTPEAPRSLTEIGTKPSEAQAAFERSQTKAPAEKGQKSDDTTTGVIKSGISAERLDEAPRSTNPASKEALSSIREEMGKPEEVMERHYKLKPESEQVKEDDYRAWRELNLESAGERPVEVYRYKGVEIAVPKDYNETLNQLRQWRSENPGQAIPESHPLYEFRDRALPEDIAAAIDSAVPNPGEFRRINLLNEDSVSNAFLRQQSPEHQSAAEANPEREVSLYKPKLSPFLEEDILHEWSHIAKWTNPELSYLFDQAAKVELYGHKLNEYAGLNGDENFAVHASEAIGSTLPRAQEFAQNAPVRAAVLLKMFKESFENQPPTTPRMERLRDNVEALYKPTLEQARKELVNTINESTHSEAVESAAKTLLVLGETSDFAAITKAIPKLDLTLEPLTPEHLEKLKLFKAGITQLNLTATRVIDDNLTGLSKLPTLAELTLQRTSISNWGVGELAKGNPIARLNLNDTPVNGGIIQYLSKIKPESLTLKGTRFTGEEFERLKRSLSNTTIEH